MAGEIERRLKVVGGTDTGMTREPFQPVVEFLEDALELARAGHIHTAFVVMQGYDRGIITGWSQSPPQFESTFEMLGGIENAKIDFINREIDRRE